MRLVSLIYSKHTISSSSPSNSKARSMATLRFSFFLPKQTPCCPFHRHGRLVPLPIKAYKVTVVHDNRDTYLEVEPDKTILFKALGSSLSVPHDCKLDVCMTCPAKLISGVVGQSEEMLSDDVIEQGFALLCASYPRSDCTIRTIPEEELLSFQLATAND